MNQAALSPDGQRIATAGSDANVRIWKVVSLAWNPGGKQLASFSQDGTLLVPDATLSYEEQVRKDN